MSVRHNPGSLCTLYCYTTFSPRRHDMHSHCHLYLKPKLGNHPVPLGDTAVQIVSYLRSCLAQEWDDLGRISLREVTFPLSAGWKLEMMAEALGRYRVP